MEQDKPTAPAAKSPNGRPAGIVIALAAIGMITVMAHHPLPSPGDTHHFIEETLHHQLASAIVHGALIGIMGLLMLGFTGLADQLGWSRLSVRAGVIAYAIGFMAMTAAALTDGLILPALASRYVDTPAGDLEAFRASSQLLYVALAASARLGVFSSALAVVFWSLALVWRARSAIGVLGLFAGVGPIVLLLTGRLPLHFYGMIAFIGLQAAWYLAIAVQLIRRKL